MTELCMNLILDERDIERVSTLVGEKDPAMALATYSGRVLHKMFEQLEQRGVMPLILSGNYRGVPIGIMFGSGMVGRYSGPETGGKAVENVGMVSLKVKGAEIDTELIEQQMRNYYWGLGPFYRAEDFVF